MPLYFYKKKVTILKVLVDFRERLPPPPPPRRMDVDPRGIERIPVDEGMGDPLERHMDRRRRSRSPDRYGRGRDF